MYGLLVLNFVVPFVMVLVGVLMKRYPAADWDSQNGYNTPASRKSQEHWEFAQKAAPGVFVRVGVVAAVAEAVLSLGSFVFRVPAVAVLAVGNVIGFFFLFVGFFRMEMLIDDRFKG